METTPICIKSINNQQGNLGIKFLLSIRHKYALLIYYYLSLTTK